MMRAGTFSIVAYDVRARQCGVAISTAMPAIGGLAVFARAGAGAIATQALINPLLGVDGLDLLRSRSAHDTMRQLLDADPGADERQLAIVDAEGRAAAHTGPQTHPWNGHRLGDGYAVAGNTLVGGATVDAMADRFESTPTGPLSRRLLEALEAGQQAGGDRRGKQSAALYVHGGRPYPQLDLRVDEHHDPVAELRRVHDIAERELLPFIDALPTRDEPEGRFERLMPGDDA
ncbi:putative Ntn-hydrolase superfamily protein [Prauserella isguenensis]|uniref:Putative Ntn-hydrolase superfamily protein n=1 Tax=Prauserella isguenensis TaxID=1470180 RepID=A0A839S0I3_9PSEU|nr:DUF1028 domain-containing protein [Prauserella isguenensis]MBB3050833.1 putative Ntn-hydrolase superfamily protein [Prauserella isguenensis]